MSFNPRILFVDQTGKLGGAEFCLADLAIHLRDRASVFLFEDGPFRELLEKSGVNVRLARGTLKPSVRKRARLYSYVSSAPVLLLLMLDLARTARHFELLYANTAKALIVTAAVCFLLRKRFVFHLHDMIDAGHFNRLNRFLLVTAARFASGIVTNSEATAVAYQRAGGRNRNLVVIPNGFREEDFRADMSGANEALPGSTRERGSTVGMFGRITPWKGQKVLVRAIARLPDVAALVVGDALFTDEDQRYQQELVELAEQLGIAERIQFAGFQSDIRPLLKMVSVVAHCSVLPEPFGRVVVEAMLAGKPVIATRCGGPAEIIEHGINGLLVKPDDPADLANAIDRLLKDPTRASELAANGRRSAAERYALDKLLPDWVGFIDRVGGEGAHRPSGSASLNHFEVAGAWQQNLTGAGTALEPRPATAGTARCD